MPRISVEDALKLNLISKDEAKVMRGQNKRRKPSSLTFPVELQPKTPHEILWDAVLTRFGDIAVLELKDVVSDRKFRADIAFPAERVIVEVDGWQYHGKFKTDFQKDRMRQNLLTINNWRILRYFPGEIKNNMEFILNQIAEAVN